MRDLRIHLCALVVLAAARPAVAAEPRQPSANYLRQTFTAEDGLPSNVVNDVLQTRDGFLIVGLPAAVFRFDGHRFAELNSDPPKQIIVRSLAEGPDGDLWVSTTFGVYRLPHAQIDQGSQTLSVYHLGQGAADPVTCLRFTRGGVLWAGTPYGLFYFAKDHFQQAIAGQNVLRIEEARNGHLFITTTLGFLEWDGSRVIEHPEIVTALGIHAGDLFHVLPDRGGVTWYCTRMGIFRQSGASLKRFLPDPRGDKNGALRAYEDAVGNVWFLTAAGMFRAPAGSLQDDSLESVAPGIEGRSITADRDGNLWVGTNGAGLVRFKNRTVKIFATADGLPNNIVMTVLAAADGKLWAGNNCGGLSWFDGGRFHTYAEKDGLTNSCVNALAEDSKHDLWVGTAGGGLFRFHAGHFQAFTKADGLGNDVVISVLSAHDGSLWVATIGGLTRFRDGVLRNYTTADGLSNSVVANVFQDSSGVIWAATISGVDRLDGDQFVAAFRPPDHRQVFVAGESPLGGLYVQVGGMGISRLKDSKLMGLAPLSGTDIQVVHDDLWIAGGTGGVARVAAVSLRSREGNPQDPIDYTIFGRADGFFSEECAGGHPNITSSRDGKLWVATLGGVAMLDLSRLPHAAGKPFEYISEVEVDGKKRNAGRELILPPGLHHTELLLGSIELSSPERAHVQYRLEGIDSEWLDAKPDGAAVYTTIPHGSYLLHVRASNGDGFWDRQGISYRITQQPYFYETIAFRILMIAAGCILVASAYRFRLRQESARMKVRLEERVSERERIARELHDTLLQNFHGLLLRFQGAYNYLPARPEEARKALGVALDRGAEAITAARDTVQELRSPPPVTSELSIAIVALSEELRVVEAEDRSPAGEVEVEGEARELHPILRDEIYRITAEALRNAFRHAQAARVDVVIRYADHEFRIAVKDNGIGIDADVLKQGGRIGHWGLPGMRERAEAIGAELDVWSSNGGGTEVSLRLSAAIAYDSAPARRHRWFNRTSRKLNERDSNPRGG